MADHKAKFTISDSIILLRLHENALKKTEALKKCDAFLNTGYRKDQDKCFASKDHLYQVAAVFYGKDIDKEGLPLIEAFSDKDKDTTKKNALEAIKTYLTVFATEKAATSVNDGDLVFFADKMETLKGFSKKNQQETELEDNETSLIDNTTKNENGIVMSKRFTVTEDSLDRTNYSIDEKDNKFKDLCIGWKVGFSVGLSK